MNITRRKSDGLVEYSNFTNHSLTENKFEVDNFSAFNINSITHEVIEISSSPTNLFNNAYGYNNGIWTIINQGVIDWHLDKIKNKLVRKLEKDTDNLIRSVVGERSSEYEIAEQEAIAFKAGGYVDADVTPSISSDAIANGRTNTEACDLILSMATNWRAVQSALRANRLLAKANTKNALTVEELNTIETGWNDFLTLIRQQII